jgi:hypothetical protein
VVNVGQAVNRKVALQIAADAGAYTGASVMAVGLNQMAYWNSWKQDLWVAFSLVMAPAWYTWVSPFPCETTDGWVRAYKGTYLALDVAYDAIAHVYTNYAYLEAKRVTSYNAIDLFPGEEIEGSETSLTSFEGGNIPFRRNQKLRPLVDSREVDDGTWAKPWWPIGSTREESYVCISGKIIPHPEPRFNEKYPVWFEKTGDPAYFVWVVRAPATRALMFDSFFGGNAIPEMWAAAAARPVGGSIADGEDTYVAKMVPLSEVLPRPFGSSVPAGAIYDAALGRVRAVLH